MSISSISGSIRNGDMVSDPEGFPVKRKKGLGMVMTALFLIAQMAGAGFLSLPKAVANTGWLGLGMMVLFCAVIGFSGSRLGHCWIILEERWPEYKTAPCRVPFMEIAERSLNKVARKIAFCCMFVNIFGGTLAYIILIGGFMNSLVSSVSVCEWVIIAIAGLLPFTWLGTPKDLWQASMAAALSTMLACLVLLVQIILERDDFSPSYPNPSILSFSLGFGAILFSFGGASIFPTIQNDMVDRTQFPKSVVLAFIGLLCMYFPVAAAGYIVQGDGVGDNILLSVNTDSTVIKVAIGLQIVNLLGTYLISCNPLGQILEESFNVKSKFGLPRILVRSAFVLVELLIALAIPDFGSVVNLVGGSSTTISTFILPPLMYMKLVDDKRDPSWPVRTIPLWERVLLWEIMIVGVIGGIASTSSACLDIINVTFGHSCFTDFY